MAKRGERISSDWIRDVPPGDNEEKDRRITLVSQGSPVLDLMYTILERKLEEVERAMAHDFSNPAWPYNQANLLGKKAALEDIMKLIPSETFLEARVKDK